MSYWFVMVAVLVVSQGGSADPMAPDSVSTAVYDSAEATRPLPTGSQVPSVQVFDLQGNPVDLPDLVDEGATLVFYRGGW